MDLDCRPLISSQYFGIVVVRYILCLEQAGIQRQHEHQSSLCWRDQKIGIGSRPKCRVESSVKNASFERNYSSISAYFFRECGSMNVFFFFSTLQKCTITEYHASAFSCRELLRVWDKDVHSENFVFHPFNYVCAITCFLYMIFLVGFYCFLCLDRNSHRFQFLTIWPLQRFSGSPRSHSAQSRTRAEQLKNNLALKAPLFANGKTIQPEL
jgi:hypothetical protein